MLIVRSIALFVLAGLCEIGGGYLVWIWLRNYRAFGFGIAGMVLLVLYGIVATWQPANFGRVYAAYGGVFIAMALLWAWIVDKMKPDKCDIIGAIVALIGVGIIIYMPRK